ncbi:PD40 domain-containing protein [candidate division KSB1 bacterium]|nr:PD40 domain-containing protein [candidate division KSB1 bacterium]
MKKTHLLFLLLFVFTATTLFSADEARVLRFPTIHGDNIAFTYAGDLYTVNVSGGVARKLTSDVGQEIFPRYSHDGKWLAFTGQYDGNTEVYLMPAEGGPPKRLTYTATLSRDDVSDRMGPNNIVMTWSHDNQHIVFRSRMIEWNDFLGQLFTVSPAGELQQQLPLPRGGFCSFSPDDKQLAYNRVFREFRTWKRYRGGMADDVWIYDFATKLTTNITNNSAQDIIPMWHGNSIYFLSDRDENRRMNLYVYDLSTKATRQLTQFTDFDIKFPSLGENTIVFENGGYLYRFDLATEKNEQIHIQILDDQPGGRTELTNVSENVTNFEISPDGNRALFGARGDVFTVPAKNGPTRNLTATSGVHERNSKWSPDGRWIAYVSDATGEDEIYIAAQDGTGKPIQLTTGADTYKYEIYWSPDSKKLVWGDKMLRLNYVDIDSKQTTIVTTAKAWEIRDCTWSPDSKWIAYSEPEHNGMNKLILYSLEKKQSTNVTDGWYNSTNPAFSSDGKYLFFVSDRDFDPIYSWTEWNHAFQDMDGLYLVTLAKDVQSPFKPKSDEVKISEAETKNAKKEKKEEAKDEKPKVTVNIDADGLVQRIVALPVPGSSYRHLTSVGDVLYYNRKGSKDKESLLLMYDLKDQKETELGQVDGYEISADQKKILIGQKKSYAILDLPKGPIEIKDKLNLSDMQVQLDHHAEWEQIYTECWRQMREFFYAPNMHGLDWDAMRQRYKPLVSQINNRVDLTYIIGELIGELSVGHTYVGGGDYPKAERVQTGLLGAKLTKDATSGYFQIQKILKGQNWDKSLRSPLTEIGVNASEGDYIIAVNGKPTNTIPNIYKALVNTAGKQVTLSLNNKPSPDGARDVVVIPTDDELDLHYFNWVQSNIEKVNKATDGKVGYIHVPDMGKKGLVEFVKYFYPQLKKKALIIDVRGNGGGNVSPMLIERLRREIAMIDIARNVEPDTDPSAMIYGPKVCLLNEFSASDGDLFPYRFKTHKLGKLIGKRTWGGVVGIRESLPLLDGGYLYKPEFASYSTDGSRWIIEGHGVEPDIEVDNDPAQEFAGNDQQLNRAIEEILNELKTQEKTIPPHPPYPVK